MHVSGVRMRPSTEAVRFGIKPQELLKKPIVKSFLVSNVGNATGFGLMFLLGAVGFPALGILRLLPTVLSYGAMTLKALFHLKSDRAEAKQLATDTASPFGWPANTKVIATSLQEEYTISGSAKSLLSHLNKSECQSLDAAFQHAADGRINIFIGEAFVPVASRNNLITWQKTQKRPRFIVTISGAEKTGLLDNVMTRLPVIGKAPFAKAAAHVRNTMQHLYDVPDSNIRSLNEPGMAQIEDTMQWLQERAQKYPHAEVLIYLNGHGDLKDPAHNTPEDSEGLVHTSHAEEVNSVLSETQMKALVKKHLGAFSSVTLLVDSCYSDAWIA